MIEKYDFGIDTQKKILRFMLEKENFGKYHEFIKSIYFTNEVHQMIYTIMEKHWDRYKDVADVDIIKEEAANLYKSGKITDKEFFISEIDSIILLFLTNVAYTVDNIVSFAKHQAMKNAILKSVKALEKGDFNSIEKYIGEALRVRKVEDIGFEYFTSLDRGGYLKKFDFDMDRIPTLIPKLDRAINGGLGRKELGLIMGPSKRGKSMFLLNLGKAAVIWGKKIVHYTFELSLEKTKARYDASFTGYEYKKLQNYPKEIKKKLLKIKDQHVIGESLIIKEYPTKSCSVNMIESHLNLLDSLGYHPEMILVDYLDLMVSRYRTGDDYKDLGSICEDLRGLAGRRKIAVWSPTQTNKSSFNKPLVEMEDTSGSIEKIRIADLIITLCQTVEERREQKMRVYIAGARDVEDQIFVNLRTDFARSLMVGEKGTID